jgi:hypothetical protein
MTQGEIVIACYQPKPDKEKETARLAEGHYQVLQKLGFVSERRPMIFQAENGTILEIFEWVSSDVAHMAHDHPEVAAYWERMAQNCSFVAPSTLAEMQKPFCHFKPLN